MGSSGRKAREGAWSGVLSGGYGQTNSSSGAYRVYQDPLDLLQHLRSGCSHRSLNCIWVCLILRPSLVTGEHAIRNYINAEQPQERHNESTRK